MPGRHRSPTLTGVVLDEEQTVTLHELCRVTDVQSGMVVEMVEEGMLEPRGGAPQEWLFPASALVRVQAALRLQRHLGLNVAGAALALELLDEVRSLRRRAETLEAMLFRDPFDEW